MQITAFTDYGLRALMFLATLPPEKLTNINEVTALYGVSRNHMVKIIHRLSQLGYVETLRGKKGGIRLGVSSQEIVIGEVVRLLEPLQLIDCSEENCHITTACRLKRTLSVAMEAFLTELDKVTLQDLIADNQSLSQLLIPTQPPKAS